MHSAHELTRSSRLELFVVSSTVKKDFTTKVTHNTLQQRCYNTLRKLGISVSVMKSGELIGRGIQQSFFYLEEYN